MIFLKGKIKRSLELTIKFDIECISNVTGSSSYFLNFFTISNVN